MKKDIAPPTGATTAPVRTSDGRVAGARAKQTRRSLLASTADLLASTSYRDLKVVDIARDAGTSPATFYQYFSDVEEAILALAATAVTSADVLLTTLEDGDWSDAGRLDAATALVDAFLAFWEDHEPMMRVINLAIVEGDRRYRRVRDDLFGPVTVRLAELIESNRTTPDRTTPDRRAAASDAAVAVAAIVHIAEHQPRLAAWGTPVEDLRHSLARQVTAAFQP